MAEYFKVCSVCWAHVAEHHLEDHLRWHKNLRNIPMVSK